ncbi:3-dehydroquinate synthase [Lentzea atacamensis]|uniref:2-epi-5-epi-valiolone synthase n=1 Tax=Lentzea atacamensis TaxID=531938 RepID=A0A316HQX3_9PSEU|nr:sedoheptulose 7-phosphate cyclase [Lentzea atacamensis]PWK80685.1 3-dehydroquinate synthase [Lentzea atacamensis]
MQLKYDAVDQQWTVSSNQTYEYTVRVVDGLFREDGPDLLAGTSAGKRRIIFVDECVLHHYGPQLHRYLEARETPHQVIPLEAGETEKDWRNVERVVTAMDESGVSRREPVVAIGGGVVLDVVGFVASVYRRGQPVIRVPTTLVGLVDAGIGVKTGINFNGHKNRLGTYHADSYTVLDRQFLKTLDLREISNGLAEILKVALMRDAHLFTLLEACGPDLLDERFQGRSPVTDFAARETLRRSIDGMLTELAPNLREKNLTRLMDYGHSWSPALEMHALPSLLHGEAVNLDMTLSLVIALRRGLITAADLDRVLAVMVSLALPVWHKIFDEPSILRNALAEVTRHREGQRIPLTTGIGSAVFVDDITEDEIDAALAWLRARFA